MKFNSYDYSFDILILTVITITVDEDQKEVAKTKLLLGFGTCVSAQPNFLVPIKKIWHISPDQKSSAIYLK